MREKNIDSRPPREDDPPSLRATTSIPPPPTQRYPSWSPRRVVGITVAFGMIMALLAIVTTNVADKARARIRSALLTTSHIAPATTAPTLPALSAEVPAAPPADTELERDARGMRDGRSQCAGGTLLVPPEFSSSDGKFDLVIHFHGASDLVKQSIEAAKVNAVLCVFNLGLGSGVYDDYFAYRPRFSQVIELAEASMGKRNLRDPKVRRVALSAFSAGVGAVDRILDRPSAMNEIDSLVLLDGVHASYDDKHRLDMRRIEPIVGFLRAASRGEKLAFVTHSEIPTLSYASTQETADALLELMGMRRTAGGDAPAMPDIVALGPPRLRKELPTLEPTSHAQKGLLYVRGYAGTKAEHHRSHLHQMATTALPLLAERWRTPSAR
jgi:hypothetical protein